MAKAIGGFIIVIVAGTIWLWVMLSPTPIDRYPLFVLDVCRSDAPANADFVRSLIAELPSRGLWKRVVYFDGLWTTKPTKDGTYDSIRCRDGVSPPAFRVFEKSDDQFAHFTAEIIYNFPPALAPRLRDGTLVTEVIILLTRDKAVTRVFWPSIIPAEIWQGPAILTVSMVEVQSDVRASIVIVPDAGDAVMLSRIDCTERKKAFSGWRAPVACMLPRQVLELLPH